MRFMREVLGYFKIDAKLPSLNDVIGADRNNKYKGAQIKKEAEKTISAYIQLAVAKGELSHIDEPCVVFLRWYEKDKRRDTDNVESSVKFVLDALVKNGILNNDTRRWVRQQYPKLHDANSTFCEVYICRFDEELDT